LLVFGAIFGDSGAIDRSIDTLKKSDTLILKTARCGSRARIWATRRISVIVRDNGLKTYFASDIAYVLNKLERGFEHLIYTGAPIITATSPACAQPGGARGPPERFEVLLMQIVSLYRGGEKAKMSKRFGRLCHLAGLAQGGREHAARLFYGDAQQRSAPGLRHWNWRSHAPTKPGCTTSSTRTPGSRASLRQLEERGLTQ